VGFSPHERVFATAIRFALQPFALCAERALRGLEGEAGSG